MPIVTTLEQKAADHVIALAREHDSPLDAFDTAVAELAAAPRALALLTLGRIVRQLGADVEKQEDIRRALEAVGKAAAFHAVVLGVHHRQSGVRVHLTLLGQQTRLVAGVLPGLDPGTLACGDEVEVVLCGDSRYAVRERLGRHHRFGTVGKVEEVLEGGLLRVARGSDTVVLQTTPEVAERITQADAVVGCLVSYDEYLGYAFDLFGTPNGRELALREVPCVRREELILAWETLRTLEDNVLLPIRHAAAAQAEGIVPSRFLLFTGPPGVGKTHCCRWLATELGRPVYLINGSDIASEWYSKTEQNLRARIRAAAAEPGGAVLVWDEAEALLTQRGHLQTGVENRVLSVMLAETDGFVGASNVLFVLTTNRADQIDSALLRPLRATTIGFERPGAPETRALFDLFLQPMTLADSDRETLARIGALALFGSHDPVLTAIERDGTRRPLTRAMVASGALVRASCERAQRQAFARRMRTGGSGPIGIRERDLVAAIDVEIATLARSATLDNLSHVFTLPAGTSGQIVSLERTPPTSLRAA